MKTGDLYRLFHQSSKNSSGRVFPESAEMEAPTHAGEVRYKIYPRLPKIDLEDDAPAADLFASIKKRKSRRDFSDRYILKKELSTLLKYSCGLMDQAGEGEPTRAQPSAGGRFPVEIYPLILRDDPSAGGLKTGLYHYRPERHQLEVLWENRFDQEELGKSFLHEWVSKSPLVILMTATFERTQSKYPKRGYRYIMLEAGHIGQNLYLVSEALGLKCCAIGGTLDENLEELLDIDGVTESLVYAVAIGK